MSVTIFLGLNINNMMGDFDLRPAFIVVAILSALLGWAIIEGIIWLIKHIHITIG